MRRRSNYAPVHQGLAILAGAFSFAGAVGAATIVSEGFEGAGNIFSAPTYAYSMNYTLPNPGGGLNYMHGGPGVSGSAYTNVFTASGSPFSLIVGDVTAAGIDSKLVSYNFYAQFSSYLTQGDYGAIRVQFLDGSKALLGGVTIGGQAFVGGLEIGAGDLRGWGTDSTSGLLPIGARFISLDVFEVKVPNGLVIDGYIDNVNFSVGVVPEPGSVALLGLGSTLYWLSRRRR